MCLAWEKWRGHRLYDHALNIHIEEFHIYVMYIIRIYYVNICIDYIYKNTCMCKSYLQGIVYALNCLLFRNKVIMVFKGNPGRGMEGGARLYANY